MRRERRLVRVVAHVKALFATDWIGLAGKRFRSTAQAISEFAAEHDVSPSDLIEKGFRKVDGLANQEYAAALKNFADAERLKIEIELQKRSLESDVRKKNADARITEVKALEAELDLLKRLNELGLALHRDEHGNLTVLPAGWNCDLTKMVRQGPQVLKRDASSTELESR